MDLVFSLGTLGLAVVLLTAGAGKLARPVPPQHMAAIGLPRWTHAAWVGRAHAVLELLLAVAIIIAPGPALAAVGVLALLLTLGYLLVVWRAWRSPEPLACHCFGWDDDRPAGPGRVALGVGLVLAAVTTVLAGAFGWSAISDLHPAAIAVGGVLGSVGLLWGFSDAGSRGDRRVRPYLRRPIPAGRVTIDGREHELSDLARDRAQLLLRIPRLGKEGEHLRAAVPEWRRRLEHVDIRVVELGTGGAYRRLGLGSPGAVVLGTDGLLAGGPVEGYDLIRELVLELAQTRPGAQEQHTT